MLSLSADAATCWEACRLSTKSPSAPAVLSKDEKWDFARRKCRLWSQRRATLCATTGNCGMHDIDETIAYDDVLLLIDGKWREAVAGERMPVIDPATEKQIGWVSLARIADLEAALAAALRGFLAWRRAPPLVRAKVLASTAQLLRERMDRITRLLSQQQGKPLG